VRQRRSKSESAFNSPISTRDFVATATVAHATENIRANGLTLLHTHVFLDLMLQRHTTANIDLTAAPPARDGGSLLVLVLITSPTSAGRTGA